MGVDVDMRCQKFIIFILMTICLAAADDYYKNNNNASVIPRTNNTFPFQGYFTDSQGRPYFGSVTMGFEFCSNGDYINPTVVYRKNTMRSVKVYNGFYATKVSLPDDAFAKLASYDELWVKVYLAKGVSVNWDESGVSTENTTFLNKGDAFLLKPLVQLTAAPYALGVRGLSYAANEKSVLKIGKKYQSIYNNGVNNSLIVAGDVRINTLNATVSSAKLVVPSGIVNSGGITITYEEPIEAPDGVIGAVWN
jgi:hypothetical protein